MSRSRLYELRRRGPGPRCAEEVALLAAAVQTHARSKGRYGYRMVHHDLRRAGIRCSPRRTLKLMRSLGIRGLSPTRCSTKQRISPAALVIRWATASRLSKPRSRHWCVWRRRPNRRSPHTGTAVSPIWSRCWRTRGVLPRDALSAIRSGHRAAPATTLRGKLPTALCPPLRERGSAAPAPPLHRQASWCPPAGAVRRCRAAGGA